MSFINEQDAKFKGDMARAIKGLILEGKKLSPINIARASRYPFKEIEVNLFEIGQICEEIEQKLESNDSV